MKPKSNRMTIDETVYEIKQRRYHTAAGHVVRWTPGQCADYAGTRYATLRRCTEEDGYGPGKLFCYCHAEQFYKDAA